MRSRTTRRFRILLDNLPEPVRQQAQEAFRRFQEDPYHPGLHFKRVHSTQPVYSARVSLNYRAVGVVQDGIIVWFWVGSHGDYNKLLTEL
jgi:hypothetical protein